MSALVTLVCGYRRTGKDTLYEIITNNENPLFHWQIYEHPLLREERFYGWNKYKRIAFANALKQEASEKYGIPLIIPDSEKDLKQFRHYKSGELVSARDIYIEWGAERRAQNQDYWCEQALTHVPNDPNVNCIITDWRFRNEAQYAIKTFESVVTIRVWRSDVPEPSIDIESEHNLDKYRTDYLLVLDDDEFKKAVIRFPQYANYIHTGGL